MRCDRIVRSSPRKRLLSWPSLCVVASCSAFIWLLGRESGASLAVAFGSRTASWSVRHAGRHTPADPGGLYRPKPTAEDLRLAKESRDIKVYVYDLAAAGFAPPLNATDAHSPACDCAPSMTANGAAQDPCNNGLGRLHTRVFARPFQGNFWGNSRGGQDNMKIVRARLETGYRRVEDPGEAQLFFIPLEVYDTCMAKKRTMQATNRKCGLDYRKHNDFAGMWRWLLQQDAFAASDGTDHFMFTEFPFKAGQLSYLQQSCPLFAPDENEFTEAEVEKLEMFSRNVNQLTVDVSFLRAADKPRNIHYIPFATNFHYVPKLPGREVRLAASYPEVGLLSKVARAGNSAKRIRQPPAQLPWVPATLLAHQRPILACYVGKNTRKPAHANDKIKEGWRLKDAALRACENDDGCFAYHIENRTESAATIAAWPGVAAAAAELGYASLQEFEADARTHYEAVYALSTFCLTPPGDTPKRKGIHDAWNMGCIPVVVNEHSRELTLYLTRDESAAITVFLPPKDLLSISDDPDGGLSAKLRELAPNTAAIRAAIAAKVTRLHFAYSDLGEDDHAQVGPDALDVLLHGLVQHAAHERKGAKQLGSHSYWSTHGMF